MTITSGFTRPRSRSTAVVTTMLETSEPIVEPIAIGIRVERIGTRERLVGITQAVIVVIQIDVVAQTVAVGVRFTWVEYV